MQLTRERIIAAAVELIEREGPSAVSMRRIADELGTGVMALYDHVPSKAALLDGVAEQVMSGLDLATEPGADWEDELRTQARAFWRKARIYPRCTMVVISRPVDSAATLQPVERALATLRGAGFGGEDAVRMVRAYVAYVAGALVREVGVTPGLEPQRPLGQDPAVLAADRPFLDPAEFPQVMSLSAELLNRDFEADFEFGLDLLVGAIASLRPARRNLSQAARPIYASHRRRSRRVSGSRRPGTTQPPTARHSAAASGIPSASRSPTRLATLPISTGPLSRPRYPAPATRAIPVPERAVSTLPATDSNCGNVLDSPAPNSANPTSPAAGLAVTSATARPIAATSPHPLTSRAGPNRAVSRSPNSRPIAIVTENAAYPRAANAAEVPRLSRR